MFLERFTKKRENMNDSNLIPIANLKNCSLIDIIDIGDLQLLQNSFAKANRVASTIVDLNGVPIVGPSNHSAVCKLIRETKKGMANCIRSGKILGEMSLKTKQPYCHFCQSVGFIDAAAPIVIDNIHLANWLIGQNCVGEVDEKRIIAYGEEIEADTVELLNAFREMPKISEEEFKEKLDFLWLMANHISNQAYQHLRYQNMLASLEKSQKELSIYKDNLEIIVTERTAALEKAIEQIQQISVRDALTGCFNRGGINKYLPKEMKRARRYNTPISIIICDLDHFKNINDTYGHQSGDLVLKQVVARMQELIREDVDWLARYGGEEFLLVMPNTHLDGGIETAERLRKAISEISFLFSEDKVNVTASFGVCGIEDWQAHDTLTHESLLKGADICLYRAKKGGRNQVVSSSPPKI